MIEVPRGAVTADEIATEAQFFSFGTNDLTQLTFGFSRDDAGKFLGVYQERKILERDPFQSIDTVGVGQLVAMAVREGAEDAARHQARHLRRARRRPVVGALLPQGGPRTTSAPRRTASRGAARRGARGAQREGGRLRTSDFQTPDSRSETARSASWRIAESRSWESETQARSFRARMITVFVHQNGETVRALRHSTRRGSKPDSGVEGLGRSRRADARRADGPHRRFPLPPAGG